MPRVNKFKGVVYPGFTLGFPTLPPEERWRLLTYLFDSRVAPPRAAVLRVCDDPRFSADLGSGVRAAATVGDRLRLDCRTHGQDRKRVQSGKRGAVRVGVGGWRYIKK